jgi:hypothetical protein
VITSDNLFAPWRESSRSLDNRRAIAGGGRVTCAVAGTGKALTAT